MSNEYFLNRVLKLIRIKNNYINSKSMELMKLDEKGLALGSLRNHGLLVDVI